MQFLVSVIDSQTRSPHTPQEITAINDFNDMLSARGQRIFAGGLDSPTSAVVFDNRNGANKSSEGPFISSDEFFSGFWLIEAESLETAKELAAEGSRSCNRKVELRPLLG